MADPTVATNTIRVEHVRIVSPKTFNEVRIALESQVPQLDPAILTALHDGDPKRARQLEHNAPLFIFLKRDHGALLSSKGRALQYDIGNPLTASLMTVHRLPAALYAPLRVVLYESPDGRAIFEYDKPSTLFGQFGDADVDKVAHELDMELEKALQQAAR